MEDDDYPLAITCVDRVVLLFLVLAYIDLRRLHEIRLWEKKGLVMASHLHSDWPSSVSSSPREQGGSILGASHCTAPTSGSGSSSDPRRLAAKGQVSQARSCPEFPRPRSTTSLVPLSRRVQRSAGCFVRVQRKAPQTHRYEERGPLISPDMPLSPIADRSWPGVG
jgi:hypothetical protein